MKKNVKEKLNTWASHNNWLLSNPVDGERFWNFVIEAFNGGDLAISEGDFYGVLVKYCNDEDILTEMYTKYKNGIALLQQSTKKTP